MFKPYQGCAWAMKRSWKRETGQRIGKQAFRDGLLEVTARCMTLFDPVQARLQGAISFNEDVINMVHECCHYGLSHQVVYLATPLAERLACSEIAVNLDGLKLPFRLFELCFENSFEILPGLPASSCLALVHPDQALMDAKLEFFSKAIEHGGAKLRPPLLIGDHLNVVHIQYRSPFPHENSIYHARINTKDSKGEDTDDLIERLTVPENTGYAMEAADAPQEKLVQARMMRVVLGTLCYLNTKDPDVREYRDKNRLVLGDAPVKGILLGSGLERLPPGWHLRKAHWRFLKHERFSRDEVGQVRCVWVRATEVNKPELPAVPAAKVTEVKNA